MAGTPGCCTSSRVIFGLHRLTQECNLYLDKWAATPSTI